MLHLPTAAVDSASSSHSCTSTFCDNFVPQPAQNAPPTVFSFPHLGLKVVWCSVCLLFPVVLVTVLVSAGVPVVQVGFVVHRTDEGLQVYIKCFQLIQINVQLIQS